MVGRETEKAQETYASAGVDLDAAGRALEFVKGQARTTFRPEVLTGIGAFAGLFQLSGFREPVLVSSVDGVGTKVRVAIALDRHDTIGVDLVNHCVNDIFTCGAEPLFFLDYIAMGKLVPERVAGLVSGLSAACRDAGCALIGGETAEMPGLYAAGDYDLAGFIVGVVERDELLHGTPLEAGDAILALASSGLHTNGYSLVRTVFDLDRNASTALAASYPELGRTLGEELLEPHRCYYQVLKGALRGGAEQAGEEAGVRRIKALAHITGGGIVDNVARIIPQGLMAHFRPGSWPVPPIFDLIRKRGNVDEAEMYRVFNMGIGMVLICPRAYVDELIDSVPEARLVGEVAEDAGKERVAIS